MAGQGNSVRAIFFALGANFIIFLSKGVAAFITGSGAMLAETVHSLADCGNQGLLLLGLRQSRTPPSADYPLGYGKAIYFWSFLVAVMLFSVGGMFSLYEGIHKLQHPEPIEQWWWAAGVLVVSIIAESVSTRLPGRGQQGSRLTRPGALVSREPASRAHRHFRRRSRRADRAHPGAGGHHADGDHGQSHLGCSAAPVMQQRLYRHRVVTGFAIPASRGSVAIDVQILLLVCGDQLMPITERLRMVR